MSTAARLAASTLKAGRRRRREKPPERDDAEPGGVEFIAMTEVSADAGAATSSAASTIQVVDGEGENNRGASHAPRPKEGSGQPRVHS